VSHSEKPPLAIASFALFFLRQKILENVFLVGKEATREVNKSARYL
jgi:hypothetical protein